ncbi:glycogen synthase [Candidatus Parcubacteria bacterium]|jgi:starch synthase|nr:glycogen synthase [Candidatus Parcubacteria bacterium]MBT7228607.1 glycogen synthase [Candidatus Parcubacteria bacterium]
MKKLKIVSVSSEVDPYSKTGGLADVARSLPKSLHRLGHDVMIVTPFYKKVIDQKKHKLEKIYSDVKVRIDKKNEVKVSYYRTELLPGLRVYFVRNDKFFSRRKDLYGSSHENARFYMFDVAVLKLISLLKHKADIIHCHDWQTGLIPYLKNTSFKKSQTMAKTATVFTIHNLVFQLGRNWWEIPLNKKDKGTGSLPLFNDPNLEYVNFAKRAILNADALNTVSETYAEEILKPSFGQDLQRILINRKKKLFGVVNGIDNKEFNPNNDPSIKVNYDHKKLQRKKINKKYIQKLFKLPIREDVPVICSTSRLTYQKGFELILRIIHKIMHFDMQMIIAGAGDKKYISELKKVAKKYPDKLVIIPSHEKTLKYENQLYAGSDMILIPSHHEPCGINQMKAFRYGCAPIVRSTGGLNDTVINYEPGNEGNGFKFKNFSSKELLVAITRALETYKYHKVWRDLICRGMKPSFSWEHPAKKYIDLYKKALKFKKEKDE